MPPLRRAALAEERLQGPDIDDVYAAVAIRFPMALVAERICQRGALYMMRICAELRGDRGPAALRNETTASGFKR